MGSTRTRDDEAHSLLSKAHDVSQTKIDVFLEAKRRQRDQPMLPRSSFGTYEVKELEVDSALTDCQLPGRCWSLNPYTGCSHDCAYCYVPDVAHLERDNWGSYVAVKTNLPTKLSHELKSKTPRRVFLSSATDPYQPVENDHEITRKSLELIAREDWPVRILTRSPLVTRDIQLFDELSDVTVGLSIPTLDDEARRIVEPTAPPIQGRLSAVRELADAGLEPFVNLAPAYPLTGQHRPDEIAETFREAGASVVYAGRWRYLDDVLGVLDERTDETAYAEMANAVSDDDYYDRLFASLGGAFRRAGVPFHEM